MGMVCVCDISALELYRASGRLLPEILGARRTALLREVGPVPSLSILEDDMVRVGVRGRPYHLLVPQGGSTYSRDGIALHYRSAPLPPRSLVKASRDMLVVSPELMFLELAASGRLDAIELALIGFELCGTYVLDVSWDGCTPTQVQMTSTGRIARLLSRERGARGAKLARCALGLVLDGSHSPMETVLAMLLTCPRRFGGFGLEGAVLNHRVSTFSGERWVDVAFPDYGVGLEYQGREYHGIERTQHDDRRQNELVGMGMTILNVWYEDVSQKHLFQQLVCSLARAMGIRLRIRSERFETRQELLRERLLSGLRF